MIHEILPVGLLQCNCSIFGDESTHEAIVVDPGAEIERIVAVLKKHQLHVKSIVITHGHIDHVAGAEKLHTLTGAPIYMNEQDQEQLDALEVQADWLGVDVPAAPDINVPASEGLTLRLGETEFHIMETPGHTRGSICLFVPQEAKLIAGDTLFRNSIGRTDLPGGDSRKILESIKTRLLDLPDETVVIPGHGAVTDIGTEKELNPFLREL